MDKDDGIKIKTQSDFAKKNFFDEKDNKYRVEKLLKLVKILEKDDFDTDLDDLRFTKLKKYKDYSLVKLSKDELKQILKNSDLKDETYLKFLGINKVEEDKYSLQLDTFLDKFIRINLKEITFEENVDLIFQMFDKNGDGLISKKEAVDMIKTFNEFNSLSFDEDTLKGISDSLFNAIDTSKRGNITKEALGRYLEKYKEKDITINPFVKVKTSDFVTKSRKSKVVASQSLDIENSADQRLMQRVDRTKGGRSWFQKFWYFNKKMVIWTAIYIVLCISFGFINRALEKGRQYTSTKAARFFAGVIFFNMALILLFMCNFFLSFLSGFKFLKTYLPLDDTKYYHQVCGAVVGAIALLHTFIHIFGDFAEIAALTVKKPKDRYVTVAWLTFANLTGITGFLCLLMFTVVIIMPLIKPLVDKHYEVFLHTHKIAYLGLICLLLHANTPDTKRWPYFVQLVLPLTLFVIEMVIRLIRYIGNKTTIKRVRYLKSKVILLELVKPKGFDFKCGQYCQLLIPELSKIQWHPFTIASSPKDDGITFFINPAGDWTKALSKINDKKIDDGKNEKKSELLKADEENFEVRIDGPHGAPAEHYDSYEDIIMIAGGVGATPFISILIGFIYKLRFNEPLKQKSISFYWIQRDYEKTDFINNVLDEINIEDKDKLFDINVFITSAQQRYDFRSLFIADGMDLAKKDSSGNAFANKCIGKVYWGRPEWDEIFKKKTVNFRKEGCSKRVGVFICANDSIVNDVYESCTNYSSAAVTYDVNPEHF